MNPPNAYTPQWFASFLDTIPEAATEREVEAIARRIPPDTFPRVLDVCCGAGRHATLLAARGHTVTGVDRDAEALRRARAACPGGTFLQLDQREIGGARGPFDAVVVLWQSFGYFDAPTNDQVLEQFAAVLRPGGRLLLDLYHPGNVVATVGMTAAAGGVAGLEIANSIRDGRLSSVINYPDGASEEMSFELFSPESLRERVERVGFRTLEQCCWWEEDRPPDAAERRYQSVFERR